MKNIKVYDGIVKVVPTNEQFESFKNGKLDLKKLKIKDTIREIEQCFEIIKYVPIKLTYCEIDENGNEKFILNDEGDFEKVFKYTPILSAYGKEMRILKTFNKNHPVKVVVEEIQLGEKIIHKVLAIQDQTQGKL